MLPADIDLPPRRGFDLAAIIHAMRDARDGALLALTLDIEGAEDLDRWSTITKHPVIDRQLLPNGDLRLVVRKGVASIEPSSDERRLWLYANFHCNLACDYCCVRSSPAAEARQLPVERAAKLAQEARVRGYDAIYVTGGEPFLRADIEAFLREVSGHLPTTVLTNAMLFRGAKLEALDRLRRDRVRLQVSLDSHTPALHDAHRGTGSWARALEGIDAARKLGFRVRIAATTTTDEQMREMDAFLERLAIPPADRVIRPLARRGNATSGIAIQRRELRPEITATATGWYWHPVGATDDDLKVADARGSFDDALHAIEARLEADEREASHVARAFPCA